jgi:RNA polymerase sigma-70 factor (ECF subfamily)
MANGLTTTAQMQGWIDCLRAGDESARDHLIECACARLRLLTRKMLRRYPRVRRWEETDDVFQNVTLRLRRTLAQVAPENVRDFLRLASLNIRRELLDLVKHYYGPQGLGAHQVFHQTQRAVGDTTAETEQPQDLTHEPSRLAAWSEFHEQVEALPADEREVFDLLWYQGLSQAEAAEVLHISDRTLQRRWQAARTSLYEALRGELPPSD